MSIKPSLFQSYSFLSFASSFSLSQFQAISLYLFSHHISLLLSPIHNTISVYFKSLQISVSYVFHCYLFLIIFSLSFLLYFLSYFFKFSPPPFCQRFTKSYFLLRLKSKFKRIQNLGKTVADHFQERGFC